MNDQPENSEVELDDYALEQAAGGIISHSGPPLLNVPGAGTSNVTYNQTLYFTTNLD